MMMFEYWHYMRFTLSTCGCNQQSCFDRICPEVSNNVALANSSEPEQLNCWAESVDGID